MKIFISIFFSIVIFAASFKNSLFYFDYKINRDFYEALCINKSKPELDCNGKCQVKQESEKSQNPISEIKYAFEFNIVLTNFDEIEFKKPFEFETKNKIVSINHIFTLDGYLNILPDPPQILG